MRTPEVTVLMPVYNGETFIREAIESVLGQTFSDFEFLIVDDGSTDGTRDICEEYKKSDSRLRVIPREHRGLIATLNDGCRLAGADYIARMDSDDVSLPQRLERQYAYLKVHRQVGILGTWVAFMAEDGGPPRPRELPVTHHLIQWTLTFRDCIVHPSVMMRKSTVSKLGYYRTEALHVEDYDLWARAIHVTTLENLPEVLYLFRPWKGSVSALHSAFQERHGAELVMPLLLSPLIGKEVPLATRIALYRIAVDAPLSDKRQIKPAGRLLVEILNAFLQKNDLGMAERRDVRAHAGLMLYTLASYAARHAPFLAFAIFLHAVRSDPKRLSLPHLKKMMRGLLRRFHSRTR